ncbi:MAG: 4Fe-4S binding protein, partial [Deltaproteobacteria bacterium]|nr:4Fe-4S binding protein [Deltaproteobacteria bacterium]
CWKFCPAGAIHNTDKTIVFDYDRCIRCYCCMEICPHGAVHLENTLPGKLLERIIHKR